MNYYNEHDPKAAAWLRELIKQGLIPAGIVDERSITEIKPHELHGYIQCHFFAGIGGWSRALELSGWPATRPVGTGSCPCQPFSSAGKQLAQADARHLWPVFFALICACRDLGQQWAFTVFGEQVASAIGKGWLDGVSSDLEGAGYACGAVVLGAHSLGSPHIRQRLYWVADAASQRFERGQDSAGQAGRAGVESALRLADANSRRDGAGDARTNQRPVSAADGGDSWQRVVFSGDTDEDGNCPACGIDYSDCGCPGPTQDDEFEYEERDGILYARRLVHPICEGLEGHAGHGDDGHQPGRLGANADRPTPAPGCDCWSDFILIPCADGKARRIEPGLAPLAHGVPARVVRLRGFGNAIVPQVAAEFIQAFCEARA